MKKMIAWALGACLLMSSCATTTQGAYTGGTFGTILGSAIGGILGGPRGSDIGTIVGMAGGAAVGAAAGHSSEKAAVRDHYERVQQNKAQGFNPYAESGSYTEETYADADQSGFDPNNSGDDRLFDFSPSSSTTEKTAVEAPNIEIRHAHFNDANHNGSLQRGELGTVTFEVINRGTAPLYNVQPTVLETTGNRQVAISQPILIECIMPGKGVRYTATVKASARAKNNELRFVPTVYHNGSTIGQASTVHVSVRR